MQKAEVIGAASALTAHVVDEDPPKLDGFFASGGFVESSGETRDVLNFRAERISASVGLDERGDAPTGIAPECPGSAPRGEAGEPEAQEGDFLVGELRPRFGRRHVVHIQKKGVEKEDLMGIDLDVCGDYIEVIGIGEGLVRDEGTIQIGDLLTSVNGQTNWKEILKCFTSRKLTIAVIRPFITSVSISKCSGKLGLDVRYATSDRARSLVVISRVDGPLKDNEYVAPGARVLEVNNIRNAPHKLVEGLRSGQDFRLKVACP